MATRRGANLGWYRTGFLSSIGKQDPPSTGSPDIARNLHLPPRGAVVRTRVGRARQAPFTVSLTNFKSIVEPYEHIQTAAPATAIG